MVRILSFVIIVSCLLIIACSNSPEISNEKPVWRDNDRQGIDEPDFNEPSLAWISAKRTTFDQAIELLDLDRNVRKLFGKMPEAQNVNSLDEVPNSTWFTNRHGYPTTSMTPEEIKNGIQLTPGPDAENEWYVFRPKVGGATIGFWIEDSRGDQYIIKFDPDGFPELATSAAAMGSRYFHACGYNTAQETIVYWHPERLRIRDGATYKDKDGVKQPLTLEYIMNLLKDAHREPNGTIRSLASLNLGNVKGPFMYDGTRNKDINDWCPHENRRELRGLYVIGSLVNHYDLKDHNSMDVYIGEDGEGYLKHYLMDFGSTFGADGRGPKPPRKGYSNLFDLRDILVTTGTLGIKTWSWEFAKEIKYKSIGYFESDLFKPDKFDPILPNPAFEQMTIRDAYWGAKIVMSFSDDDLRAIVRSAQYTNQDAAEYLLKTLIERRDKIGKHWFGKLSPLDYFSVDKVGDSLIVSFKDLGLKYGLEKSAVYEAEYYMGKKKKKKITFENQSVAIDIREYQDMFETYRANHKFETSFTIEVSVKRESGKLLSPAVVVAKYDINDDSVKLLSIEH